MRHRLFLEQDRPKYTGPPPQCIKCSRFVNIKTAHEHLEIGDFGTVLSVEFECERCAKEGKR